MGSIGRVVLAVFLVLVLGGLIVNMIGPGEAGQGVSQIVNSVLPEPTVTKPEYDALATGMTYQQAVTIIGDRGEEMSRNELAGFITVMYMWQNSDGSNMNAMFQNDGLVQKAQFGLK